MALQVLRARDAFPFMHQIIMDAYKTDSILYTHPYQDTATTDRGLRRMIWGESEKPPLFTEYISNPSHYQMAVVKSTLGYYNIMASLSLEPNHPDFITIGPFTDRNITETFVQKVISSRRLSEEQALIVENFYDILPVVDVEDLANMVLHILGEFIPEYRDILPTYINYSEETHKILAGQEEFRQFADTAAEAYAKYLKEFLDGIATGDYKTALDKLKLFLDADRTAEVTTLSGVKKKAYELNSFCKMKLLDMSVHPYYPLNLAESFSVQIDACSSYDQLMDLQYKMIRKYCMLVKNYNYAGYSYLTRNVVSYIDQHIDEKLSLSVLAEHFQKNASFLSGQFSRETGESVTEYIHHARIQAAVQYFNTTDMSVTEVASSVGIPNFGYFSRLFRSQIGMSPREYKKMLNK